MSNAKVFGIYAELDCLLDTRLGTLARLNEAVAGQYVESEGYYQRLEDRFPEVDMKAYRALYRTRDIDTLKATMMTNIFVLIRHLCTVMRKEDGLVPHLTGYQLTVNLHPYVLSVEEKTLMQQAIDVNLGGLAEVNLISSPIKDLTPRHCKNSYRFMIVYDWNLWLETHYESLSSNLLPEVCMLAPAIYHTGKPSDKQMKDLHAELAAFTNGDPGLFRAAEEFASVIINLQLIDVMYFSIISQFSQTVHTSTLPEIYPSRTESGVGAG